ncbi:PREDICTED: probable methyltransferase PMT10 [Tarenaya hassleriana]|uniref:probable methyltransferase PMT10 n=1 Tax=Tarenaya hassleriana TaxID=28532 RepID=UPI00053C6A40|nr:PREDICTED: probable methyltransferase PMT10 [Tarenaya hassleriana]
MKPSTVAIDIVKTPKLVKFTAFALLSISVVVLVNHFSSSFFYPSLRIPLISNATASDDVIISPSSDAVAAAPPPMPHLKHSPPPLPPTVERTGIIDDSGAMSDTFEVGGFDPDSVDELRSATDDSGKGEAAEDDSRVEVRIEKFKLCDKGKTDYIPCLDNEEEIKKLNGSDRGEKYERHCRKQSLDCLIPPPDGYKKPIPWPQSRDKIWFNNVPHTRLVEDKGGQNWIRREKDKFVFPGGGTQFIHGADHYLDQISQMVPGIAFGQRTRLALDIGCGVASFGAFLMQRNVTTLSIAPKDIHENQIQFALERGVPAMVAVFATRRLLYPSQAFEMIHCSRCRINWTRDDGILLLEANRMLRAGGYFVWAAQPVYKHEENLQEQWKEMVDLTSRMCWELVKKEGYIAVWRKPLNNSCYIGRGSEAKPPLCGSNDDADDVWYVDMKPCITRLPDNGYGANVSAWPARLHDPPERLQSIQMDAYISRKEIMKAESRFWNEVVESYVRAFRWKEFKLRNVLDMKAGFGGFAAALLDLGLDSWVLNVVPVSGFNTLPVIYDRGLIGVMHDWCEPFDTYPRTYDLLHAAFLFSVEKKRCNITSIILEMDRMLRPGGRVYIRDSLSLMDQLQKLAKAVGWTPVIHDTGEGPHASVRILICEKRM